MSLDIYRRVLFCFDASFSLWLRGVQFSIDFGIE